MLGIRTDRIKPANPSHLYHVAAFVTSVLATCSSQDFYHALIATSLHQPSLLSTTLLSPPPCTNQASSLPRSHRHLLAPTQPPRVLLLVSNSGTSRSPTGTKWCHSSSTNLSCPTSRSWCLPQTPLVTLSC